MVMRTTNYRVLLSIMSLLVLSIYSASSQMSKEIYDKADNLVKNTTDKVYYGNVRPVWIGKTNSFLYENLTPAGTDYIIVDAENLSKKKAFDREKFATALESVAATRISHEKLPVRNIVFSDKPGSFTFIYDNYNWTCNLKNYKITRGEKAAERSRPDRWDWGFRDELSNDPVESPDKKWTAYIKNFNVYIRSAEDKKEYRLSYDGALGEYYSSFIKWSPDSRKLAVCRVRPAEKHMINYIESSPADQLQPKHYSYEYQKPGDAIPQKYPQLFDVESKKHIKVDDSSIPNQYYVDDIKWSKDSRYFTYEYNKRGHQIYQVIKVNAATGKSDIVVNETSPTFFDYSGKMFRYDAEETEEIIWTSERDGWNHLYLFDSETGNMKNQITTGNWVVRDVVKVDEKNREIIFQASGREPGDPYFIYFYRIGFDGTGLTLLSTSTGNHEASFSPDWKYFVDTWSTVDTPPVSVLRKTVDGSVLMEIEKADITALLATGLRLPEVFEAKGRDGKTDIWGIIIRPSDFDPSKKYPVIEDIYAGPHSSFVPKSFRPSATSMHQLAELGFIVVKIDGMGTSNRSKAFHDVCWKNLKDAGFPDRILWMKAAAEKYPYMDLERVGVYGTSAGGQSAAGALLFYPGFYKVAVASCGCHDNRMDKMWWNEQWMGWPVGEEYAQSSNVDNAWRLKGKLLLINGEMDNNVDPSSTVQVVNALIKADKDFEYVLLPGARHTSGGTYGERKRRDFFVKNLLGMNPPDWNLVEK
jgi:dipeptidyl aminopeptidase/acylaminoacyl peptidase